MGKFRNNRIKTEELRNRIIGACFRIMGLSLPAGVRDDTEVGSTAFNLHQIEALPLSAQQLKEATLKDPQLSKVMRYTQEGWPREVPTDLKAYHQWKAELGVEAGCLFWGTR